MDCFLKRSGHPTALMASVVLGVLLGGADAFAEDQPCPFDVPQTELKVASCVQEGGVNILKLMPRNQPDYDTNLDNLPTFILTGKNLQAILAVIGTDGAQRYNKLIELPNADSIMDYSDAAPTAKAVMQQRGWTLLDMKDVISQDLGELKGLD